MRAPLVLSCLVLALLSTSCSVMPKWLGGRETCSLVIPNTADPTAPGVSASLMSSGDEHTEDGIVELRKDRYDRAYALFKKACATGEVPDVNSLWLLGVCCELLGKFDEAEDAYDKASLIATSPVIEAAYTRVRQAQGK